MKKLLLLCLCTLTGVSTFGQIEKGTRFWGATLDASGSFSNRKEEVQPVDIKRSNHSIALDLQWGKFVRNNVLWGLGLDLQYLPTTAILNDPLSTESNYKYSRLEYGIEPFIRKYKSINERFRIFIQPSLLVGGIVDRTKAGSMKTKRDGFKTALNIVPGISYQVGKRFAIESDLSIAGLSLGYRKLNNVEDGFSFNSSVSSGISSVFTVRGALYID